MSNLVTALGRVVPIEDWPAIHRDAVMKRLYDEWMLSYPDVRGLAFAEIEKLTGLDYEGVALVLRTLMVERNLVRMDGAGNYVLTDHGFDFVSFNV